jgi:transposase-like protein
MSENMQDMNEKGRRAAVRGMDLPQTRLTDEDIAEIRALSASGEHTHTQLARRFQVHPSTVSRIAAGKRRKRD